MAPSTGSPSWPSISLGNQDPQSSPSFPQAPPTHPSPATPPTHPTLHPWRLKFISCLQTMPYHNTRCSTAHVCSPTDHAAANAAAPHAAPTTQPAPVTAASPHAAFTEANTAFITATPTPTS